VPDGIAYGENLGWAQLRQRNNDLASDAAKLLSQVWGTRIGTPDAMRAHMASVEIPLTGPADEARAQKLWAALYDAYRIQMPVIAFAGGLWARPSVQIYNRVADYEALAKVDWRKLDA
jgi:isopenicillin-N epimerase